GASSAPGAWPRSPTSPRAESRPGASATTCASSRPASAPPPRAPAGAAVRASSAEVVDQVDRGQGVGAAGGRVLDLGVVPRLQAGLEREALVHRHRHAEVVLGEGVVLAGLDQQGVEQLGVGGELVAQVEQAAADQAALHLAVQRGAGAAVAGADFAGELGALAVDEAAAEADGQGALVVVGGEVVALVAAVGRDMVARAEAVGTGAGDVVAVGAGLVVAFLDAVAVHVALDLGARAQRRQGEAVLPALLLAREAQARVEALGAGIAAGHGQAELAGAGPAFRLGRLLGGSRQRQQGNEQQGGDATHGGGPPGERKDARRHAGAKVQ